MIASLLPGLRELRTPLAAGYMWLLFAWLLVEPSVPSSREELTGVSASISRLIDEGSVVALGAGITFVAYLVGTVYVGLLRAPLAAYRLRTAGGEKSLDDIISRKYFYATLLALSIRGYEALSVFVGSTVATQVKRAGALGEDNNTVRQFYKENGLPWGDDFFGVGLVMPPLMHITHEEFGLLKLRLLRKSPELFAEVDRGFAEAEFRLAIVPPLAALAALLTVEDSPLWAIAILVLPVLIGQGIARNKAAGDRLVDTLVLEEIKSPLLERLERKVDEAVAASEVAANKTTDQPQDAS